MVVLLGIFCQFPLPPFIFTICKFSLHKTIGFNKCIVIKYQLGVCHVCLNLCALQGMTWERKHTSE